jgi:exodeoxyribonuclease VII small subunit
MEEAKKRKKFKFEQAISDLEQIVNRLDSGELSLDEMLEDFEAGTKLVKECQKFLEQAQKRVEMLVSEEGKLEMKELETEAEEGGEEEEVD